MMTEALSTGRQLPTPELLALLLAVMEVEPRTAPDELVELVRREVERLAGGETGHGKHSERKGGAMTTIDAWTYRSSVVAQDIVGYDVEAVDGEIGTVSDASDKVGASYIVVDTGPWIFGKKVMLPAIAIDRVDHGDERVWVNRTKDEIKNAPEFDESRYDDEEYRRRLGAYYARRAARTR